MRGARLYTLLVVIALSLLLIVMVRSCRSGNNPQSNDDAVPVAPSTSLALPALPLA